MGILLCLYFLIKVYYRYFTNDIDYNIWDIHTITIDDYSVEVPITEEIWTEFKTRQFGLMGINGNNFRDFMTHKIESFLKI